MSEGARPFEIGLFTFGEITADPHTGRPIDPAVRLREFVELATLADTMSWFRTWLDGAAQPGRPVVLVGFSGGAAFAGGLVLDDPARYAGAAILYGTLPFDAGVPTTPARLTGLPVLVAQGDDDTVIPRELLDRTWDYLRADAGADTRSVRGPGGHGLSQAALAEVDSWLSVVLELERA